MANIRLNSLPINTSNFTFNIYGKFKAENKEKEDRDRIKKYYL